MLVAFAYIDDVALDIRIYYEYGVLVPADVEALSLADGIELGSFVAAYDLAERVGLVTRLLDVMLAGTVDFGLETQGIVVYGFREPQKGGIVN